MGSDFKKGQSVKGTTTRGRPIYGVVVEVKKVANGVFVAVSTTDGEITWTRPSMLRAA
jgi:hypothetical protein